MIEAADIHVGYDNALVLTLPPARVRPPGRRQCMLMIMVRKRMYIDEELNDGLRHLAARTGRPEAEHVREPLRQYLWTAHHTDTDDSEPLIELIGLVEDAAGPADVALHHDDYLYGTRPRRVLQSTGRHAGASSPSRLDPQFSHADSPGLDGDDCPAV